MADILLKAKSKLPKEIYNIVIDYIDWDDISYKKISETFIIEHKNKLNWDIIYEYNHEILTESLIRKLQDFIQWGLLFILCMDNENQLSYDFIYEFRHKFDLDDYIIHKYMPDSFFEENEDVIDWSMFGNECCKISYNLLMKYGYKIGDITWYRILRDNWLHGDLPDNIIREYYYKIDFDVMIMHSTISEYILRRFYYKLDWNLVSEHQKLSESFIRDHSNKLNWNLVSKYQKLSESFIEEMIQKVNMYIILQYQSVSKDFIILHIQDINWLTVFKLYSKTLDYRIHSRITEPEDIFSMLKIFKKITHSIW